MKLYQYNMESGVYAGELFGERGIIQCDEGITAIAPPPYEQGQVPVFNLTHNRWEILSTATVRQLLHINTSCIHDRP